MTLTLINKSFIKVIQTRLCYYSGDNETKGSLQEKKTEIVRSFAKPGGLPPNQTSKRFPAFSSEKYGNCAKLRPSQCLKKTTIYVFSREGFANPIV
jgi:hypothetical protein